jgi:hypothetical protein
VHRSFRVSVGRRRARSPWPRRRSAPELGEDSRSESAAPGLAGGADSSASRFTGPCERGRLRRALQSGCCSRQSRRSNAHGAVVAAEIGLRSGAVVRLLLRETSDCRLRHPIPSELILLRSRAPLSARFQRSLAVSSGTTQGESARAIGRRNPPNEAGFGSTERRRSRTYPAWGCHASPVLKVCESGCAEVQKRMVPSSQVRSSALRFAGSSTKFGTSSDGSPARTGRVGCEQSSCESHTPTSGQ